MMVMSPAAILFSLSIPLCEWLTSTPSLLPVYYLFFCWIFAVALVWYLVKKTERGKTNYKWDGKPDQLKDFITPILKRDGQWKPKKCEWREKNGHFYRRIRTSYFEFLAVK